MNHSFPKSMRVISGQHFTLVLRKGGCAADACLVVFAMPQKPGAATSRRLGVTIPKKTGNAVVRNQWKRWIREAFRTQQDLIPEGYDFIVRPKKGAAGNWKDIQQSIGKLPRKAVSRIKR